MQFSDKADAKRAAPHQNKKRIRRAILKIAEASETAAYSAVCEDFEGEQDAKRAALGDFYSNTNSSRADAHASGSSINPIWPEPSSHATLACGLRPIICCAASTGI